MITGVYNEGQSVFMGRGGAGVRVFFLRVKQKQKGQEAESLKLTTTFVISCMKYITVSHSLVVSLDRSSELHYQKCVT